MFPPMTSQTERVRVDLENREIEQRAAINARIADGEARNIVQAITRLFMRREPKQRDLQANPGFAPNVEQTA